jgi:phosphoserine phosphatase
MSEVPNEPKVGDGIATVATTQAGQAEAKESARPRPLQTLSATELVKEVTGQVGLLAKKQIDLATTELRADLTAELAMVKGLGVAAIASILAMAVLLVAGVLALATLIPGWQAALIVGGFLLLVAAIAAAVGWAKRVSSPLHRTRQTLKEDVQWTKEKLA